MPTPIKVFQDNIRPAKLMLRVYNLLDTNDQLITKGKLVESLRGLVEAEDREDLYVIYNEVFLGLVRESAQLNPIELRRSTLCHLLRQAVVAACTGLDTYLPALLRTNLPTVIRAVGRDFVPMDDGGINEYLKTLNFSLDETMRLLSDPKAEIFISTRILSLSEFSYLSNHKGVHVVGRLLGIEKPWESISTHLSRDKKELMKVLNDTVTRRNDIIHRADRCQEHPEGDAQEISFSFAKHATDTIDAICLALNELVEEKIKVYQALITEESN